MMMLHPDRRRFLQGLAAVSAALLLPRGQAAAAAGAWDRLLVLVELQGGNDGLNTLVPLQQEAAYRALRPALALPAADLLRLNGSAALHPSLKPFADFWQAGELAVVQGVGYAQPNHSHFRSIEIWDSASRADEVIGEGWVSQLFARQPPPQATAEGVIFGRPVMGPLLAYQSGPQQPTGGGRRFVMMDTVRAFARRGLSLPAAEQAAAETPALLHLLKTQTVAAEVARGVADDLKKLEGNEALEKRLAEFPQHNFGRQCAELARLLAAGSRIPVAKLSLGGFDTHVNQLGTHARLLGELAGGLAALRGFARELGVWDRLVVATYSEFGRRAAENRSAGTDHGTAAPHFVLGGKVRGGLKGEMPDLEKLVANDLIFTTPMQQYFASLARESWQLQASLPAFDRQPLLGLLA